MSNLLERSLSGLRWSASAQLLAQVLQYGAFIVLARLLAPTDFGTVAAATLAVGLAALLNELGFGAAIIQRQDLRSGHLHACFWANAAVGLGLWAALAASAPWLGGFFQNPQVAPLLVWLAASFPLLALAVVPKALMERALRFKELALIDALAAIANGGTSIAMAFGGHGAWSLVVGTLAAYVVQLAGLWMVAGYQPSTGFGRRDFIDMAGFGINVLGTRLMSYVIANVDYLVIGRLLGPAALGAYSLAYKLVTWPMMKISHVTLRVALPAFARIQDDNETFCRHYVKLVGALALIIFPLLGGLALLAPEVIPLLFGPQWSAAIFPTQILCLVGALKAMVCSIGTIFLSRGRPDLEFKLNAFGAVKLTVFVLIGARWGIDGVAIAYLLSSLTGVPLQQYMANRLIGLSTGRYLQALAAPGVATLLMGGVLAGWRSLALAQHWPVSVLLLGAIGLCAATYLSALSVLGYDWQALVRQLAGRPAARAST
jgi:O-antigen/teichoic acid export membrane protein